MSQQQNNQVSNQVSSAPKVKPTPVFGAIAMDGETVVSLPYSQLVDSLGKTLYYQHQHQSIPVLCRQTHETSDCRGLHVEPNYLLKLGPNPGQHRPCCAYCGDPFTRSLLDEVQGDPKLQLLGPIFYKGVMYPIERLMITQAVIHIRPWDVIPDESSGGETVAPPTAAAGASSSSARVCRDHAQGYCPRGKDCNMLHLCRNRAEAAHGPLFTSCPPSWAASSSKTNHQHVDSTRGKTINHTAPPAEAISGSEDCAGNGTEIEDNADTISNPAL